MSGRIVQGLPLVVTAGNHLVLMNDYHADRNLAGFPGQVSLPQGLSHENLIQYVLRHARVRNLAHHQTPKTHCGDGVATVRTAWHATGCTRPQQV